MKLPPLDPPCTGTGLTPSRARAFRVALELTAGELADRLGLRASFVLRCEDGAAAPGCGWDAWEAVLDAELAAWMARDGRPWTSIWPTPFEAWRLQLAAGVVVVDLGEDLDW